MRSLQNRLLVGAGVVVALGLTVSSIIIYSVAASTLYREFDNTLQGRARALAALTEYTEDGLEFDFVESDFAEFSRHEQPQYFQLWQADGSVLGRSPSLLEENLARDSLQPDEVRFAAITLPDGRNGRQVSLAFCPKIEVEEPEDEDDQEESEVNNGSEEHEALAGNQIDGLTNRAVTVSVAMETGAIDRSLASLGILLTVVGGAAVVVCLALLAFVVRRILAPFHRVSAEIERINEQTLDARLDIRSVPLEVVPIVERLNGLFKRLESAFNRERAFSSDVAHELRTPLAGLRSTVEVCRSKHRSSAEYCEALDVCLQICDQAQGMVETLLVISQVESGRALTHTQSIRLEELLRQCWEPFAADAAAKRLRDRWQLAEPCEMKTDRDKLSVVIRNILENAVSHSDAGGEVSVSTQLQNGSVRLCVENSGNRLAGDQVDHVFQRFWRGDVARTDTGKHAGLGLPLAERLTGLLGGDVRVECEGTIFRVLLEMPVQPGRSR